MLALISTRGPIGSRIRLAFVGASVMLAATACSSAVQSPPTVSDRPLVQRLAGEVSDARALKHLQALQQIADEHGGNRASGTPGYHASVKYVVGVLRDAGFKPSTPTYEASGEEDDGASGPQRNVGYFVQGGEPGGWWRRLWPGKRQRPGDRRPSGFSHDRAGAGRSAGQDRGGLPGGHRIVGDDESPFIETGIPVGGAESGDDEEKTAKQAKAWGGQAGKVYDPCYHQACDNIDNVNQDMLDHYMQAIAGTLAHFATSTDQLR